MPKFPIYGVFTLTESETHTETDKMDIIPSNIGRGLGLGAV